MQAQAVHGTVQHNGQARQVADIFKQAERGVEGEYIGQHRYEGDVEAGSEQAERFHRNRRGAQEQGLQEAAFGEAGERRIQQRHPGLPERRVKYAVYQALTGKAYSPENRQHHYRGEREARGGAGGDILEPVQQRGVLVLYFLAPGRDPADKLPFLVGTFGDARGGGQAPGVEVLHGAFQPGEPLAGSRHKRHHPHAELALQGGRVDGDAPAAGYVPFIQEDYERRAQAGQFQGVEKVALQVRGVHYVQDQGLVCLLEQTGGDLFRLVGGGVAVGARHVHHGESFPGEDGVAGGVFHGGARVVG